MNAILHLVLCEAPRETGDPLLGDPLGEDQIDQIGERSRALRRKIGEVDAQRFLRDEVGRVAGEEMHALDDRVGFDDQFASRGGGDRRDVVEQPPGPWKAVRQRREIAGDQFELAHAMRLPGAAR